jgi:hypothetical protein
VRDGINHKSKLNPRLTNSKVQIHVPLKKAWKDVEVGGKV